MPSGSIIELFKELDEDRAGEISYEDFIRKLRGAPPGQLANQLAEIAPARKAAAARMRKATNVVRAVSPSSKDSINRAKSWRRLPLDDGPSDDEDQNGTLQDGLRILRLANPKRVEHAQLQAQANEYERRAANAFYRRPATAPALTGPRSWPSHSRRLSRFGDYEETSSNKTWQPVCHWRAAPVNRSKVEIEPAGQQVEALSNAGSELSHVPGSAPQGYEPPPVIKEAQQGGWIGNCDHANGVDLALELHHNMSGIQIQADRETQKVRDKQRAAVSKELREKRRNGQVKLLYSEWLQQTGRTERAKSRFGQPKSACVRKLPTPVSSCLTSPRLLPHRELDKRASYG